MISTSTPELMLSVGRGNFFCNNVDTGEVEATTVGLCDGVRKKRNDIDPLPQIIMIHVADTDLMRGEG